MSIRLSSRLRPVITAAIAFTVFTLAAGLIAATPSATAAGGHSYSHGSLWCSHGLISVGRGMTASVRPGESVRMTHTLYRWTGQQWVVLASATPVRTYPTSASYVSAEYSSWYSIGTSPHSLPQFPGFQITVRGYYAIAEDIRWLNSAGNVVDQHNAWVSNAAGWYCTFS